MPQHIIVKKGKSLKRTFSAFFLNRCIYKYFKDNQLLSLLKLIDNKEMPPITFDLWHLHKLIRQRKPKKVLEFGVGFSTLVIADALYKNHQERTHKQPGQLWSVDTSAHWINNSISNIPSHLKNYVADISQSDVHVTEINNQLCHMYDKLPNIVPDFVYLDGPSHLEIKGEYKGLAFLQNDNHERGNIAADMLLYESTLQSGFFMLVDGRIRNVRFLANNFKHTYKIHIDTMYKYSTFELINIF
ncbi:MAG: hypothetical protein K1X44_06355 [Alphaproteobacteria bacterium]|nr:hypothetical protein [Alphaproteobacteria bacterium]